MKFSLIQITEEKDGKISGWWIQDHIGTLASARQKTDATEKANRNHIKIGIVEQVSTTVPQLAGIFHNLVKLI
jgi:hypothetical protein